MAVRRCRACSCWHEQWYDEQGITGLAQYRRAPALDLTAQRVYLGTGDVLSYDRLILATGSSSTVPPIEGLRCAGELRDARGRRCHGHPGLCTAKRLP